MDALFSLSMRARTHTWSLSRSLPEAAFSARARAHAHTATRTLIILRSFPSFTYERAKLRFFRSLFHTKRWPKMEEGTTRNLRMKKGGERGSARLVPSSVLYPPPLLQVFREPAE